MTRIVTGLARCAAVVLGVLFVASLSLLVSAWGVENTLLSVESYERALRGSAWPPDLPARVVSESLTRNPPSGVMGRIIRDMDAQDWNAVVTEAAPPELQRELVLHAVRGLLGWLQSDQEDLDVEIPLDEIKARLSSEPGTRIVEAVVLSWPQCTAAEVVDWLVHPSAERLPLCLPTEPQRPLMLTVTRALFSSVVSQLPDRIGLMDLASRAGSESPPQLLSLRSSVQWAMRMTWVAVLAPICLLLLVTVAAVRSLKGLLGWWGSLMLGSGAVVLVGSAFASRLVSALFAQLASDGLPLPQWVARIASGLAPGVAVQAAWALQRTGAIIALAGAVLLFASALVPRRRASVEVSGVRNASAD